VQFKINQIGKVSGIQYRQIHRFCHALPGRQTESQSSEQIELCERLDISTHSRQIEQDGRKFGVDFFTWAHFAIAKIKECLPVDETGWRTFSPTQIIRVRLVCQIIVEDQSKNLRIDIGRYRPEIGAI